MRGETSSDGVLENLIAVISDLCEEQKHFYDGRVQIQPLRQRQTAPFTLSAATTEANSPINTPLS